MRAMLFSKARPCIPQSLGSLAYLLSYTLCAAGLRGSHFYWSPLSFLQMHLSWMTGHLTDLGSSWMSQGIIWLLPSKLMVMVWSYFYICWGVIPMGMHTARIQTSISTTSTLWIVGSRAQWKLWRNTSLMDRHLISSQQTMGWATKVGPLP